MSSLHLFNTLKAKVNITTCYRCLSDFSCVCLCVCTVNFPAVFLRSLYMQDFKVLLHLLMLLVYITQVDQDP